MSKSKDYYEEVGGALWMLSDIMDVDVVGQSHDALETLPAFC